MKPPLQEQFLHSLCRCADFNRDLNLFGNCSTPRKGFEMSLLEITAFNRIASLIEEYDFILTRLTTDKAYQFSHSMFTDIQKQTASCLGAYATYLVSANATKSSIAKVIELRLTLTDLLAPPTSGYSKAEKKPSALYIVKAQTLKAMIYITSEIFDRLAPLTIGSMIGMAIAHDGHMSLVSFSMIVGFSLTILALAAWSFKEIEKDAKSALSKTLAEAHECFRNVANKTHHNTCAFSAITAARTAVLAIHQYHEQLREGSTRDS